LFGPELKHIDHYTLSQSSNSDKSIKTYDKAIEINPHDSKALDGKGNALYKLNKYDEAIKSYDKAIEINPQNSDAWSNKGAVLVYLESVAKKIGIRISLFCPKHGGICSFFLFDQRFIIEILL
jgi:tetratricopeptide (TPR) repeat protein